MVPLKYSTSFTSAQNVPAQTGKATTVANAADTTHISNKKRYIKYMRGKIMRFYSAMY